MEKRTGINLLGLQEALGSMGSMESKKTIPWGIQAKDKPRKPNKASSAKKKHRLMVEASRKGNR